MKFKGDKVIPLDGRLEGVPCSVKDVYMSGQQSFIVPQKPRLRQKGAKAVHDEGMWLSWIKLQDEAS